MPRSFEGSPPNFFGGFARGHFWWCSHRLAAGMDAAATMFSPPPRREYCGRRPHVRHIRAIFRCVLSPPNIPLFSSLPPSRAGALRRRVAEPGASSLSGDVLASTVWTPPAPEDLRACGLQDKVREHQLLQDMDALIAYVSRDTRLEKAQPRACPLLVCSIFCRWRR